jgi:16S rRNA (cytidine1402-2'-O)-methyltransferase
VAGTLILCGTPIGNLGDAAPRLAKALASADLVYAEDTRRSRVLLGSLGVEADLRSYFLGNENSRARELAERLRAGDVIVLITDAGMPAVSDPGVSAVRAARGVGATISVVPGPSAVTTALAVSGFTADRFTFEGFLPRQRGERAARVAQIVGDDRTCVFFSTGKRIAAELGEIAEHCQPDREVVVCRELTKAFEEVWFGEIGTAAELWETKIRKGEFTVVLAGAQGVEEVSFEEATAQVGRALSQGSRLSDAAKVVAASTGHDRRALYDAGLGFKK